MLQYQNEQLKKDLAYWMQVASGRFVEPSSVDFTDLRSVISREDLGFSMPLRGSEKPPLCGVTNHRFYGDSSLRELSQQNDALREKNEHIAQLTQKIDELVSENDEYRRTNDRIWETTKVWIKEDSEIISKQAGQIKYLVAKVKSLEKQDP